MIYTVSSPFVKKFKTVSKSDEGQYRCEASNGVGAPKSCAGQHMKITECKLSTNW